MLHSVDFQSSTGHSEQDCHGTRVVYQARHPLLLMEAPERIQLNRLGVIVSLLHSRTHTILSVP